MRSTHKNWKRFTEFWGRFAAQREQARSPQMPSAWSHTAMAIQQIVMLAELAVNRMLDNIDVPNPATHR